MNSIDDSELHKLVERVVNQVMGNSKPVLTGCCFSSGSPKNSGDYRFEPKRF